MPAVTPDEIQDEPTKKRWFAKLAPWWFLVIVVLAAGELLLHVWQTRDALTDEDWRRVRGSLESQIQPPDLVVLSPDWIGPVGRMHLGDALMTPQRVARADESRFPRAFEVAHGCGETEELRDWPIESESRFGTLAVRLRRNPSHRPVIDDLVAHANAGGMRAAIVRAGKEDACHWRKGAPATGHLGFGPAAPAERFHCSNRAWVAETILADLRYRPRRCIYAPPAGNDALRMVFAQVRFGARLEGHHALYVEAERDRQGTPVRISFVHGGQPIGEAVHEDGQGWVEFGFDTPQLTGQSGELVVEVASQNGNRRMYCFEATTR